MLPQTARQEKPALLQEIIKKFCLVVVFGIALGYFEAAVVVYLRTIFYPDGFTFPLSNFGQTDLWKQLLVTEVGREAASIVLIFTAARLFGQTTRQRFAFFMVIFAVWDIFYYIWLRVLVGWPESIMDWDILFLIPVAWASPVLAPVIVSVILLVFAAIILYRDVRDNVPKVTFFDWLRFVIAGLIVVLSFCVASRGITESNFKSHFSWPVFTLGVILASAVFFKCLLKSPNPKLKTGADRAVLRK